MASKTSPSKPAVPKQVMYRGVSMSAGWPAKIRAAQRVQFYSIGTQNLARVPYGNEPGDWGAGSHPCGDCCVLKGELHVPGCDIERCPGCQGQAISCDCPPAAGR